MLRAIRLILGVALACLLAFTVSNLDTPGRSAGSAGTETTVHAAALSDTSPALASVLTPGEPGERQEPQTQAGQQQPSAPIVPPVITAPEESGAVEQRAQGAKPGPTLVVAFEGLGAGFIGPQGASTNRNPSDNSLAVGPDHVVQIVNSKMAVFTKQGRRYPKSGEALYGPVNTNNVFKGFGGACEAMNNGDAVARYDQLANRWLIVMPIFRRMEARPDQPPKWDAGPVHLSPVGKEGQPGAAVALFQPPPSPPEAEPPVRGRNITPNTAQPQGPYAMCYAVSTGADPLGSYYRYEFLRPLFPDYPRPAIWPDGYYIPSSTGDNRVSADVATEKHACVADRVAMLAGKPATEQCIVMHNVGFLNNADVDGTALPPKGTPNIMMAAGGTQLEKVFESNVIDTWQFHVDWKDPAKSRITAPQKISVAPYHYLCDGQLTNCVPQPGTERRLDAQGDKIMQRLVYRRMGSVETIVAVHSVNTTAGAGGVRWYEFRVDKNRQVSLRQQGTFAPDGFYRWLPSPAIDRFGNIGIGYSFGGTPNYTGQRFAGRLAADPLGQLTMQETVLVEGEGSQNVMRWEDYVQTAMDPADDCTIWYVGDYVKKDQANYSTRIGAFRMPGCGKGK